MASLRNTLPTALPPGRRLRCAARFAVAALTSALVLGALTGTASARQAPPPPTSGVSASVPGWVQATHGDPKMALPWYDGIQTCPHDDLRWVADPIVSSSPSRTVSEVLRFPVGTAHRGASYVVHVDFPSPATLRSACRQNVTFPVSAEGESANVPLPFPVEPQSEVNGGDATFSVAGSGSWHQSLRPPTPTTGVSWSSPPVTVGSDGQIELTVRQVLRSIDILPPIVWSTVAVGAAGAVVVALVCILSGGAGCLLAAAGGAIVGAGQGFAWSSLNQLRAAYFTPPAGYVTPLDAYAPLVSAPPKGGATPATAAHSSPSGRPSNQKVSGMSPTVAWRLSKLRSARR